MTGLSIKSLRVFDAIVTNGRLTDAARTLNMSQSAASRQLLELERSIGLKLFDRTNRQLIPTPEGLKFHLETRHVLSGIEEIPTIVEKIKSDQRETFSIVCMPRLSLGVLASVIERFVKSQPDLSISSTVLRHHDISRWAATRHFDIGLGMLPLSHRSLVAKPIFDVRACVLMRNDHPLSAKSEVSMIDLAKSPLIGYEKGLLVTQQIDDMCRSAGIQFSYSNEVSSTLLACQLATLGIGAAIVDVTIAHNFASSANMKIIPIKPKHLWRIGLFHLKNAGVHKLSDQFESIVYDVIDGMNINGDPEDLIQTASS